MNNKKICHFTCAHEANDVRIFTKECVSLAKAGYDVYLVVPNIKDTIIDGVNIVGVNVKSHNPLYRLFISSKMIYKKALELDADIYHFHDIELFKYGVKLHKKGKKVIFDSHEDWIGYLQEILWLPQWIKKIGSRYIKKMYSNHIAKFEAVITVSPHIVETLSLYADKVFLVTNYPDIDINTISHFNKQEYCNRDNRICYAGTVYRNSNQESTIMAIDSIDGIEYLIVGVLDDNYKSELSRLQGWNKVKFIPRVSKRELIKFYNSSLAGTVIFDYSPNCGGRKGTMGNNKIFEYMLEGLPIICTDFDSWKELVVDKYNCGICVAPNDVDAIRNAINFIIDNKEEAYNMGCNGRKAILAEFNWKTQEKVLIDIYKTI